MEASSSNPKPNPNTIENNSIAEAVGLSDTQVKSVNDDIAIAKKNETATSSMTKNNTTVDFLPQEICKRICDYLTAYDAISFSLTCTKIQSDLDLATVTDTIAFVKTVHPQQHWRGEYHDREHVWFDFSPNILSAKEGCIHSMKFDCIYKDQGWGNRKSILRIRENDIDYQFAKDEHGRSIPHGDIIVASPIAEHTKSEVHLQFLVRPGKKYTMSYYVGGGGGHELFVYEPQIQMLSYHNSDLAKASKLLQHESMKALFQTEFGRSMFMCVLDSFLKKIEQNGRKKFKHDRSLMKLMESVGVDANNETLLKALKNLCIQLESFHQVPEQHIQQRQNDKEDEEEDYEEDNSYVTGSDYSSY